MTYIIPEWAYQVGKWGALVALPAVGTAYAALAPLWGWPFAEQVPQTCQVVALLLGTLLGVSQATAKKGEE